MIYEISLGQRVQQRPSYFFGYEPCCTYRTATNALTFTQTLSGQTQHRVDNITNMFTDKVCQQTKSVRLCMLVWTRL